MTAEECREQRDKLLDPKLVQCRDQQSNVLLDYHHSCTLAHWEIAAQLAEMNERQRSKRLTGPVLGNIVASARRAMMNGNQIDECLTIMLNNIKQEAGID